MYAYTGGKTGGHIMPLISLIKENKQDAIYIGQKGNIEENICKKNGIRFIGYEKYNSKLKSTLLGYFDLKKKLKKYDIEALIASGGYVSLSACLYAIRYRIPIFLLEENIVEGSMNKWLYPFCKMKFLAYKTRPLKKKEMVSGLPLRPKEYSEKMTRFDVLIIGGSLGSKVLCDAAYKISKEYKTCLIAGRYSKDYLENKNLKIIDFTEDIYTLMQESKVIIARAGASTTAEIFYINKPFICIPSMKTKKNHQFYNAKFFSDSNGCILCLEKNIEKDLLSHIHTIFSNEQFKMNMLSSQKKLVVKDSKRIILNKIMETIK